MSRPLPCNSSGLFSLLATTAQDQLTDSPDPPVDSLSALSRFLVVRSLVSIRASAFLSPIRRSDDCVSRHSSYSLHLSGVLPMQPATLSLAPHSHDLEDLIEKARSSAHLAGSSSIYMILGDDSQQCKGRLPRARHQRTGTSISAQRIRAI
jgi:hypothetical protein